MSDKKSANGSSIEPGLVRELAAILSETGLTEIEVEHGELKLRLAKTTYAAPLAAAPMAYAPAQAAAAPTHAAQSAPPHASAPAPQVTDFRKDPRAVLSPMVGTAYLASEPGAAVFVKEGDSVAAGQTLLIVEAMKTFNPIAAPRAGKVTKLLISDAQPVEFGEALLLLE
jgi:acetyl-CoA carboxylase biotin carboxyl carrier protein